MFTVGVTGCTTCEGPVEAPNLDVSFHNFPVGAKIVKEISAPRQIDLKIGEQIMGYILSDKKDTKPILLDYNLKNNYVIEVYAGVNLDSLISSDTITNIFFLQGLGCNQLTSSYNYKLNGTLFDGRVVDIYPN